MVVSRVRGQTFLTVRGPETSATGAECPAEGEWVEPSPAALAPMMPLYPVAGFCVLCTSIAVPAMLGDVADYGRWQSGIDSAGHYATGHAFVVKSLGGMSATASFALIGWFGFDATAEQQTAGGALGRQLTAVALPALGLRPGGLIAWFLSIDRRLQAEIRVALACSKSHGLLIRDVGNLNLPRISTRTNLSIQVTKGSVQLQISAFQHY